MIHLAVPMPSQAIGKKVGRSKLISTLRAEIRVGELLAKMKERGERETKGRASHPVP